MSRVRTANSSQNPAPYVTRPGIGPLEIPLAELSLIRYRFLFYYPVDIGFGGHAHDLEAVEITLRVSHGESGGSPCQSLRVTRVAGAAHGVDWYTNTLEIENEDVDDVVFPPHVLVEEGKHASAPDRNGDGSYTPGYDSTLSVNDAWGVRDTLRNRALAGRTYRPEQAKNRAANPKIVVPAAYNGPVSRVGGAVAGRMGPCDQTALGQRCPRYDLLEAGTGEAAAYCDGDRVRSLTTDQRDLESFLKKWTFCGPNKAKGPQGVGSWLANHVYAGPEGPGDSTRRDRWTAAYSYHGSNGHRTQNGIAIVPGGAFRAPLLPAWIIPRVSVLWADTDDSGATESVAIDLLYAPSGSRLVDWYAGAGYEGLLGALPNRFVQEVGIKFRFPSGFLSRFNSLAGVRIGYRGQLFREVAGGRWVVETGIGGW